MCAFYQNVAEPKKKAKQLTMMIAMSEVFIAMIVKMAKKIDVIMAMIAIFMANLRSCIAAGCEMADRVCSSRSPDLSFLIL